jgi:hypothetical protein
MNRETAVSYTETTILLAVIVGDYDEAKRLIADMLPGERRELIAQAHKLADLCQEHDRIREAASAPCIWRRCGDPSSGYIYIADTPRGVCTGHRAEAFQHGYVVHEPPAEVTL